MRCDHRLITPGGSNTVVSTIPDIVDRLLLLLLLSALLATTLRRGLHCDTNALRARGLLLETESGRSRGELLGVLRGCDATSDELRDSGLTE
jgi:hypothetical protein